MFCYLCWFVCLDLLVFVGVALVMFSLCFCCVFVLLLCLFVLCCLCLVCVFVVGSVVLVVVVFDVVFGACFVLLVRFICV